MEKGLEQRRGNSELIGVDAGVSWTGGQEEAEVKRVKGIKQTGQLANFLALNGEECGGRREEVRG